LPHPERPTRIQRPCRIPRPSRTRPCRIRFPAAAPAIPFPRMAFLLQPPLPARGTITRRHAERFRGVTTFCPPLPARLRARKAKPPRSCPPPRDVSQTLAHRTRRPARPLPFPTPTHGGALRAIDAESRIAASDPVKVHTHVLSVSRVHDGYFFAFRIVFDSLEQLAGGWVAGSFHGFIAVPRFGPGPSLVAAVRSSARPCARPTCSPPRFGCLFGVRNCRLQGIKVFSPYYFCFISKILGTRSFVRSSFQVPLGRASVFCLVDCNALILIPDEMTYDS
jgi:hypothetical protein